MKIVGSTGPDPGKGDKYVVGYVVFGALVKGDGETGHLRDGTKCIYKAKVIIKSDK